MNPVRVAEAPASVDARHPFTMQTTMSVALVLALIGAAVTYGRQSARLDAIEIEVKEFRQEMKALRSELGALRELLIQRTSHDNPLPVNR
jgi:hypothetical protein